MSAATCFPGVSLYLSTTVSPYATSYCSYGLQCTGLRVAARTLTQLHSIPQLHSACPYWICRTGCFAAALEICGGFLVSCGLLQFVDPSRKIGTRRSPHSLSFFGSMQGTWRSRVTSRLSPRWRRIANFTPLDLPGAVPDTTRIGGLVESLTNEKV
jgi:hypothetical protein